MTTLWSDLPNAVHIDRVIASLKSHPDQWGSEREAVQAVWVVAWNTALDATIYQKSIRDAVWNEAQGAVRSAAWNALLCLVAHDDCAYMLDSDVGELKILAAFGDPRAILLLPACIVFNAIKEIENVK